MGWCEEVHSFSDTLSCRRLNSVKEAYNPTLAGRPAPLTARAFNQLCPHASIPGNRAYYSAELSKWLEFHLSLVNEHCVNVVLWYAVQIAV